MLVRPRSKRKEKLTYVRKACDRTERDTVPDSPGAFHIISYHIQHPDPVWFVYFVRTWNVFYVIPSVSVIVCLVVVTRAVCE